MVVSVGAESSQRHVRCPNFGTSNVTLGTLVLSGWTMVNFDAAALLELVLATQVTAGQRTLVTEGTSASRSAMKAKPTRFVGCGGKTYLVSNWQKQWPARQPGFLRSVVS